MSQSSLNLQMATARGISWKFGGVLFEGQTVLFCFKTESSSLATAKAVWSQAETSYLKEIFGKKMILSTQLIGFARIKWDILVLRRGISTQGGIRS